jgi:hypothetical protein
MRSVPGDRAIARYVRRTVYPFSAHYRSLLDATGVGRNVRSRADLARIPPTDLRFVDDPAALVLRPDFGRILRHGGPALTASAATARVAGAMPAFSRHVDRRFKPIIWALAEEVPIGYSTEDAAKLARRGAAWLERAGVTKGDVVVSLLPSTPSVAYWQLVLGCRRAGVSALHLGATADPETLARWAPSIIVGDPVHLTTVLADARHGGRQLRGLRAVLAVGPPLGGDRRARLSDLAAGAPVVGAWAPPGVRALWSECLAGASGTAVPGYHAWPDDVLEYRSASTGKSPADGELLWTGLGWTGSVLLRLRTFAAVAVGSEPCPACGAPGERVLPHGPVPRDGPPLAVEDVLDREPEVAAWLVEYRSVNGSPETIVTLAPADGAAVGPLLARLGAHLRATQFVVASTEEVAARVQAAGGDRIVGVPGT